MQLAWGAFKGAVKEFNQALLADSDDDEKADSAISPPASTAARLESESSPAIAVSDDIWTWDRRASSVVEDPSPVVAPERLSSRAAHLVQSVLPSSARSSTLLAAFKKPWETPLPAESPPPSSATLFDEFCRVASALAEDDQKAVTLSQDVSDVSVTPFSGHDEDQARVSHASEHRSSIRPANITTPGRPCGPIMPCPPPGSVWTPHGTERNNSEDPLGPLPAVSPAVFLRPTESEPEDQPPLQNGTSDHPTPPALGSSDSLESGPNAFPNGTAFDRPPLDASCVVGPPTLDIPDDSDGFAGAAPTAAPRQLTADRENESNIINDGPALPLSETVAVYLAGDTSAAGDNVMTIQAPPDQEDHARPQKQNEDVVEALPGEASVQEEEHISDDGHIVASLCDELRHVGSRVHTPEACSQVVDAILANTTEPVPLLHALLAFCRDARSLQVESSSPEAMAGRRRIQVLEDEKMELQARLAAAEQQANEWFTSWLWVSV